MSVVVVVQRKGYFLYSMLMRLLSGAGALGTTMLRIPFFREARTAFWLTRAGKLKLRENSPTERSEIQYCCCGCCCGCSGSVLASSDAAAGVCAATVVVSLPAADELAGSSSSTVGW